MHQDMYLKALALYLLTYVTAAYRPLNFSEMKPNFGASSIILPINGNVYPSGCYTATIIIGDKSYVLDIDSGSDLTWVKCAGYGPYDPYLEKGGLVRCIDFVCKFFGGLGGGVSTDSCKSGDTTCDYTVKYADGGSSSGFLVWNTFQLKLGNGTTINQKLSFGCGYDNKKKRSVLEPIGNDGILGLGKGESGILKQLSSMGVVRNVVGHCLSGHGGGFIFFGNDFIPRSELTWMKVLNGAERYALGSADLLFDGNNVIAKGLQIIFDSGSTYTYFNSDSYRRAVWWIYAKLQGLPGTPLNLDKDDKALPVCWKGRQKFGFISDAAKYFPNLVLSFAPNVKLYLNPKHYLIISEEGNACLGILNGGQVGLGGMNVIGDISMEDKMVVYDNENGRVGWGGITGCSWT